MPERELVGMAELVFEMGLLKRLPRSGWLVAGVERPESVAEHSFRTALIGLLLAHLEGVDPARTALMGLVHDTQEARVGDVPAIGKPYVTTMPNERVTADQVAGLPEAAGAAVRALVAEFEAQESPEARVARDADKLECLVQAREYQASGHPVAAWVETAVAALRTDAGKRLARACQEVPPDQWWRSFATMAESLGDPARSPDG